METKITAKINDKCKLLIYNIALFKKTLNSYKGKEIEIIIREKKPVFSDGYRKYYYGIVIPEFQNAYKDIGVLKSKSDIDLELRWLFLHREVVNPETGEYNRELLSLKNSDTEVSTKTMSEFIEHCIIFAAENLNYVIPFPNEFNLKSL